MSHYLLDMTSIAFGPMNPKQQWIPEQGLYKTGLISVLYERGASETPLLPEKLQEVNRCWERESHIPVTQPLVSLAQEIPSKPHSLKEHLGKKSSVGAGKSKRRQWKEYEQSTLQTCKFFQGDPQTTQVTAKAASCSPQSEGKAL